MKQRTGSLVRHEPHYGDVLILRKGTGEQVKFSEMYSVSVFSSYLHRPDRVCEADHSPPTDVGVKNTWIYTSTPPYVFMA
jgi:hypothetical protein